MSSAATRFVVPPVAERMPVAESAGHLRTILDALGPDKAVCLFIAHRGGVDRWEQSISRVATNLLAPERLACVPVEVESSATQSIYAVALDYKNVVGLNHLTPHKDRAVLKSLVGASGTNLTVDFALRDGTDGFSASPLNGPSFGTWFERTHPTLLPSAQVVVFGCGATGRSIAEGMLTRRCGSLTVVDRDETTLRSLRSNGASTSASLFSVSLSIDDPIVLIDATGQSRVHHHSPLDSFLSRFGHDERNVFVDLRTPRAFVPKSLEMAQELGWIAHDGSGMSAFNDWSLAQRCLTTFGFSGLIRIDVDEYAALFESISEVLIRQQLGRASRHEPVTVVPNRSPEKLGLLN